MTVLIGVRLSPRRALTEASGPSVVGLAFQGAFTYPLVDRGCRDAKLITNHIAHIAARARPTV